jgi:flavin-dependent dehydrogenase
MTGRRVDVLVVGAGPTGLALALQVLDHGRTSESSSAVPSPFVRLMP